MSVYLKLEPRIRRKMATLFDDNGSDDEGQLTINQGYADKYDKWREKEEYQKCKMPLKRTSFRFITNIHQLQ